MIKKQKKKTKNDQTRVFQEPMRAGDKLVESRENKLAEDDM